MIYLGADHGGFSFKEKIKKFLDELNIKYEDIGNDKFEPRDDFVDYALAVTKKVRKTKGKGILICTNGLGMCVAANKVSGIRAVNITTKKTAKQSREHLDSNILCLGSHIVSWKNAKKIIKEWIETEFFRKERYIRRLDKIRKLEND
ncbi:RpiB/LacA/LacB family sugar-phosphate isomerase [Patescibacteria group bacterium]|nr:RpiB/LacA/LacB family sugar-phosphate isomerase [Patescibacteria group bacterium]MBU3923078.1 RpiB/LacA/LacB family sugar-phosphate isomerase [Patescibacteria group bacterium]